MLLVVRRCVMVRCIIKPWKTALMTRWWQRRTERPWASESVWILVVVNVNASHGVWVLTRLCPNPNVRGTTRRHWKAFLGFYWLLDVNIACVFMRIVSTGSVCVSLLVYAGYTEHPDCTRFGGSQHIPRVWNEECLPAAELSGTVLSSCRYGGCAPQVAH